MSSSEFAHFLRVALDVQSAPYEGVHISGGVAAATDAVMLVAAKFGDEFLRGEGAISPKAAKVLQALAEVTYVGRVDVDGNRVTAMARSTRYEAKVEAEVAGEYCEVTLPEFWCRQIPIKRMVGQLTDAGWEWVNLVENPRLKNVKEWSTKEYVALMNNPREGYELFRLKDTDDAQWYSVAQLRLGLRLFGRNSRLSVRRNRAGWLAFSDQWGYTFAITPFVKRD